MGRKTKYKKKYCKEILEKADLGWPIWKIAYHWGVTEDTLRRWRDTYVQFEEAYALAKLGKKVYWHDELIVNKEMSAQEKKMWATIHMDYSDKQEVKSTQTEVRSVTITIAEPIERRKLEQKENNIIDVTPTNQFNKSTS